MYLWLRQATAKERPEMLTFNFTAAPLASSPTRAHVLRETYVNGFLQTTLPEYDHAMRLSAANAIAEQLNDEAFQCGDHLVCALPSEDWEQVPS